MDIIYYVDDGYAGSERRPHHIKVDDSYLEECESDKEMSDFIEETIREHFSKNIRWYWDGKFQGSAIKQKG